MSVTGFEITGSRKGSNHQPTRQYHVEGAENEAALFDWLDSQVGTPLIPSTIANLPIADANYDELEELPGHYNLSIAWGLPEQTIQEVDSLEYRFNFQAAGGHFVQSLATVGAATNDTNFTTNIPAGLSTINAPNFQGGINAVPTESGAPRIEGLDVQPPPEVFTLSYRSADAAITKEYQLKVQDLCGKVNSVAFADLPAGSTMLLRCVGGRSGGIWTIEFGFGYVPNVTASDPPIVIGNGTNDIAIPVKDGLDLLWVYREPEKDSDYGIVHAAVAAAYVERVWERADLNELNLPGI